MKEAFHRELTRWGPEAVYAPPTPLAAASYCARLARSHYENFTVVSLLLPRRLLRHFYPIYAWCRWADDLADETGSGNQALRLLRWWREELDRCYRGTPHHPVTIALMPTLQVFDIPKNPFEDLLWAFEQDQLVKRYRTFSQLLDYCRCSANPVGHLILYLARAYSPLNAAFSDCICTGLQLANFWQDVGRDLDIGRVYLPEEDRRAFGYSDSDLHQRRFTPQFALLMRFEVERTRELFRRGLPLADRVPPDFQVDIELFARGGLAILAKIEQQRYNVWRRRPQVSKTTKAWLLLRALFRRLRSGVRNRLTDLVKQKR